MIYFSMGLAAGMITFGGLTYQADSSVSRELIIGGVALISIVLGAYVGFATLEDVKLWKKEDSEIL
jgi:hypothetical protein